ncbi:MAG: hypothetical protein JXP37_09065, partial [Coriobacteriia bacterium]|nr:hypothetical protein [Coriobacteriia bacterium]
SIPPLHIVASLSAGAGVVAAAPGESWLACGVCGVLLSTFLLFTLWDMRRRRGTLAVYIRLRRAEIGFEPRGDVIEAPKLMFLVMNQPTPLIWLVTGIVLGAAAVAVFPSHAWVGAVPLAASSLLLLWAWARNRTSAWEPLARRLRWLSLRSGERLIERLEHALDIDPEVILLRQAADAAVARFVRDHG